MNGIVDQIFANFEPTIVNFLNSNLYLKIDKSLSNKKVVTSMMILCKVFVTQFRFHFGSDKNHKSHSAHH